MRDKKPGEISDDLRISLGMPVGPVSAVFVECFVSKMYFQNFTESTIIVIILKTV